MAWYILVSVGVAGGILGGMGMGGGTLLIPMLTMLVGFSQMQAQAINLISFVPMAIVSVIILTKNKLIDVKTLAITLPLAIVGCVFGSLISSQIDERILSKIFGAFILIVGVIFMIKTLSSFLAKSLSYHNLENHRKKVEKRLKSNFN